MWVCGVVSGCGCAVDGQCGHMIQTCYMEAAWKMANLTLVPSTLSSSPSSLLTLMYVPVLTSCVVSSSLLLPHPL